MDSPRKSLIIRDSEISVTYLGIISVYHLEANFGVIWEVENG